MEIYLVGGALRDEFLNLPVKDRDWLVTGATVAEMLALGYQQVGRDFPVFLHPETKEEYALARTERKQGQGYHGFVCDFSPEITVEEDLQRRDLTINAIARDSSGKIIDPYNGLNDLQKRFLRHVSPAFQEDPLRVLRVLRFWARFAHLGFTIAHETWQLMQKMADSGELSNLTRERILLECEKALSTRNPELFFQGLRDLNLLNLLALECEENLWQKMLSALKNAQSEEIAHRWALFLQDCDSSRLQKALPLAKNTIYWLELVHKYGHKISAWHNISPEEKWRVFQASQSLKQHGNIFVLAELMRQKNIFSELQELQNKLQAINPNALIKRGFTGSALGEKIKTEQIEIFKN